MKKILLSSLIAVMAVSAANAKIASTDYADYTADAAKNAAISAAATDAQTKATAALGSANEYTDTEITKLTSGAIKTNTDAIAEIKEDMKTVASSDTVTNIQNTLTKLDGADTTDGSVRQLIKAANDTQNTEIETAYAKKATTLEGYGIADAYTETEVNNLLSAKADSANVYTKTEIDTVLGENGTTGQAIAAAAQAATQAATAAAAAQSTADGAVSVNNAQATAITNLQNADTAINEKFGDLGTDTVAQAIAAAQTAATYDDTAVLESISTINNSDVMKSGITAEGVAQIETNKTAIATLNGTGEGSLSKAVADGIAGITASVADGNGAIATLTQTDGKVSVTRKLVATTDLDTTVNDAIDNANAAAAFMSSVQDASTAEADADKAYVLTASKGQDGTMTYAWEEIDRTVLNND